MFPNVIEIVVKATTPAEAKLRAEMATIAANKLSLEALKVVSTKASQDAGELSRKIVKHQNRF